MRPDDDRPATGTHWLEPAGTVIERIALRSMAARSAGYPDEIRRLFDAGLTVIARNGTDASPKIADVVAEAGMSNDAFYRHFAGKDEFISSIIEAGTLRLERYLTACMAAHDDPGDRVRAFVAGMMRQARVPAAAAVIRAVLWNGQRVSDDTRRRGAAREQLAQLLVEPATELGSTDPEGDALLVCYAVMLRMEEFLWRRDTPSDRDVDRVAEFALRALGATSSHVDEPTGPPPPSERAPSAPTTRRHTHDPIDEATR